jgi:hypothetical protein
MSDPRRRPSSIEPAAGALCPEPTEAELHGGFFMPLSACPRGHLEPAAPVEAPAADVDSR